MDLIHAIVYGIVQGLTEFLPISSSAHIRIIPEVFGWRDPGAAFTANIQLGTLLAVLIYFRQDLANTWRGWTASFTKPEAKNTPESRLGWAIVVGTIPIIILGFAFRDAIETNLRSLYVVATMLIVMALVLALAEWMGKKTKTLEDTTVQTGLIVGLWQAVALIPGASRSGSTISGAMFLGFERATAARLSFLLSVPSIFLAAAYTFYKHRSEFSGPLLAPLLVANVFSFIVGYACIAFLIKFLQTKTNLVFIIYRLVLGSLIFGLLMSGVLKA